MQKAGAQRIAAELGIAIVAPDTSPRGEMVADDKAYDLGQGAGFYLNATQTPTEGKRRHQNPCHSFQVWRGPLSGARPAAQWCESGIRRPA